MNSNSFPLALTAAERSGSVGLASSADSAAFAGESSWEHFGPQAVARRQDSLGQAAGVAAAPVPPQLQPDLPPDLPGWADRHAKVNYRQRPALGHYSAPAAGPIRLFSGHH